MTCDTFWDHRKNLYTVILSLELKILILLVVIAFGIILQLYLVTTTKNKPKQYKHYLKYPSAAGIEIRVTIKILRFNFF